MPAPTCSFLEAEAQEPFDLKPPPRQHPPGAAVTTVPFPPPGPLPFHPELLSVSLCEDLSLWPVLGIELRALHVPLTL